MNKAPLKAVILFIVFSAFLGNFSLVRKTENEPLVQRQEFREITGKIKKGETLFDIFNHAKLDLRELCRLREASANIHRLRELYPGRPYKIVLDNNERINAFVYGIDDNCLLYINRTDTGYYAEKVPINYERRMLRIGGTIQDNLIDSLGGSSVNQRLALQLSDIFAWDIDFSVDLRNDDSFKIVVEGLYLDGKFKKYGNILSAEFSNDGGVYHAYAFEQNGKIDYYDETGEPLRKAFLKAPLSFRRISSVFSRERYHPILKIHRPHQGIDYVAARGTPVSATGDGTVLFAGRKGQYGNLVIIRHGNGFTTYYGHLSKIGRGVRNGAHVDQGGIIGYVGATGLATGPHLHYEMRVNDEPLNPMSTKLPSGAAISETMLAGFRQFKNRMNGELATVRPSGRMSVNNGTPQDCKRKDQTYPSYSLSS